MPPSPRQVLDRRPAGFAIEALVKSGHDFSRIELFSVSAKTFGEHLVSDRVLSRDQVHKALEMQQMLGGRLGTNLLELGFMEERSLLERLGRFRAMPIASPDALRQIPPAVLRSIPAKLVRRCGLIPFQVRGKTLLVASKDPGDPLHEDEVSFMTGFMVRTHVALELHFDVALRRYYKAPLAQRLVALTRRLSTSQTALPAPPSGPPKPAAPLPAAPLPATPLPTPMLETPTATPPDASPAPQSEAPVIEQIELDDADLALLRTPSAIGPSTPSLPVALTPTVPPQSDDAVPGHSISENPDTTLSAIEEEAFDDPMPTAEDAEALAAWAGRRFQAIEIRDEIGDVLLAVARASYHRAALVIRRKDELMGWMADGDDVPTDFRALRVAATAPSVFFGLQDAASFWLGPLPGLPANGELVTALGGSSPKDCLVLPISLRSKIVGYLYVDNRQVGVAGTSVADMKRLVAKAGLAFEIYILRNKIRMM